jgi:hypothetical protein
MIPAYKVMLFGSISASMYMMGRLVLVSCMSRPAHIVTDQISGPQDLARKELDFGNRRRISQARWTSRSLDSNVQTMDNGQILDIKHKFLFHYCTINNQTVMLT